MISSLTGLKRTWPKVNHLLTVIDPTRRLTCASADWLSWSMAARRDSDRERAPEEPDWREPFDARFFAAASFQGSVWEFDVAVVGSGDPRLAIS